MFCKVTRGDDCPHTGVSSMEIETNITFINESHTMYLLIMYRQQISIFFKSFAYTRFIFVDVLLNISITCK